MRGTISITDWEWFQFLREQPGLDEVNFWRPTDLRKPHLPSGTPFIFKLREEFGGMIVGFGIFAGHVVQPMWLAWEEFGAKNGAPTFADFLHSLERIRRDKKKPSDPAGSFELGCILLAEPCFFPREAWIPAPSDWKRNVVQGASYDLSQGEGARIWAHCLEVAGGLHALGRADSPAGVRDRLPTGLLYEGPRHGALALRAPRMGQGIFRATVIDAYGRACAVTTEHSLPVLEAAHIKPYEDGGEHQLSNGLLLRTDIHRLFDRGYVTVTPDLRFHVSGRLRDEFSNGRTYYALEGKEIATPREAGARPAVELLEWHARERFRG